MGMGLYAVCVLMLCVLLGFAAKLLATKAAVLRDTARPFECGFDPKNSARIPFSLRFFLLAIIFLIFDVEVALLLPLPLALGNLAVIAILPTIRFLLILLLGLAHEWREGSLDWA